MLSRKVMSGIGYNTQPYEENNAIPDRAVAAEIASYLNKIVSSLIRIGGVSQNRHIEMLFGNLGDSLGGSSRNEVGRAASSQVIQYIATYMHRLGHLTSIRYILKGNLKEDYEENDDLQIDREQVLKISRGINLESQLLELEKHRVKYRELAFDNGCFLRLDKQVRWHSAEENKVYKTGPDFHSTKDNSNTMIWVAELKGGADPAGSDEHWKTATQALERMIEASQKTGRKKPDLSFIATILVERVATEAQEWIDKGKLTSVYNLTKIEENEEEREKFLRDIYVFLGYTQA